MEIAILAGFFVMGMFVHAGLCKIADRLGRIEVNISEIRVRTENK